MEVEACVCDAPGLQHDSESTELGLEKGWTPCGKGSENSCRSEALGCKFPWDVRDSWRPRLPWEPAGGGRGNKWPFAGGLFVAAPEEPSLSSMVSEEDIQFYVQQFRKSGFR